MSIAQTAMQEALVAQAVETLLDEMTTHPDTPDGYSYTAERSGAKYRIIMVDRRGGKTCYAFVDASTGDIFMAASWKAAAKGVRYNLLSDMAKIVRRFTWAGGWLYAENIKRDDLREAGK